MIRSTMLVCLMFMLGCGGEASENGPSVTGPSAQPQSAVDAACPQGYRACDERCFDFANDPNHCGGCDNKCTGNTRCAKGRCIVGAQHCDRDHGCASSAHYCSLNAGACVFGCIVDSQCPAPYVCDANTKQCAPKK